MLGFLVALTAEQQAAHWQQAQIAAAAASADAAARLSEKKRPGRPCKPTQSAASSVVSEDEPMEKKRKYTQWFSSPLIHDIIASYRANGRS